MIFGGPPIVKKLILGYSDGALIPSGVTVSPRLNVSISRLEFNFRNKIDEGHIEGFSRATEISCSLYCQKPFLEINLVPSVVNHALLTGKFLHPLSGNRLAKHCFVY